MKFFLDIIEIKNDVLISSLSDAIDETDDYLKLINPDKKAEIKSLKIMKERFLSALDIVDGSESARFASQLPKSSQLDKHHRRIIVGLSEGVSKTALSYELGVHRMTLHRYLKKHNIS